MAEEMRDFQAESNGSDSSAMADDAATAMNGLRAVIDKASQTMRDLTQATEQWAKGAEGRAVEMGRELRNQGERAVGGISHQVAQNPLTSLAVAFALGFVAAALIRR
jgi:ElaB/YqjD/DUF883 family membrane-anchored ribosome-binding protein